MKAWKKNKELRNIFLIVLGVFIEACAISVFVFPNEVLTGGVAGVAVALKPIIPLDPVWLSNGLVIILYLLGFLFIGKQFALKSLVATIVYPISITGLSFVIQMFPEEMFLMPTYLASIYAGVFMGLGLGLVFCANASTGGMDILALLLNKFLKIRSGDAVMIIDGLTVVLGIFTYGLVPALIGVISVFICGQMVNKTVMMNTKSSKKLLIISDEWEKIKSYLLETIDRGLTFWEGHGGYTENKKTVMMCVIDQKQYPQIEAAIMQIDPLAFLVVSDVHQVQGEGFTFLQEQRAERMKQYEKNGNRIS